MEVDSTETNTTNLEKENLVDPLESVTDMSKVLSDLETMGLDRFVWYSIQGIRGTLSSQSDNTTEDFFSCSLCSCIMVDPITLKCGHTFMRRCLQGDTTVSCPQCKVSYESSYISELKTTVVISALLEKWWKLEMESIKMCTMGEEYLQKEDFKKAIELYSSALECDQKNHIAALNRSKAYFSSNQPLDALQDIETALKLHTFLEGYLQKGAILVSLGRTTEAIATYYECCLLCSNSEPALIELKKLVNGLRENREDLSSTNRQASGSETVIKSSELDNSHHADDCDNLLEVLMEHISSYGKENNRNSSNNHSENKSVFISEDEKKPIVRHLEKLFCDIFGELSNRKDSKVELHRRKVNPLLVDRIDFECPLCFRLLWQPITTPCGHTFCRSCLDRCFDHQPTCPLCKTLLSNFLAESRDHFTTFLENAMQTLLPTDYAERRTIYEDELEELQNAGKDLQHNIPLFVCTIAFPTVPCPLHVFEPRYRLMIRRCVEAGTHSFGMCAHMPENQPDCVASFGTMLEIRSVNYFTDGRSLVDAYGSMRFKVVDLAMRDGYHTGAVEFLRDEVPAHDPVLRNEITLLHDHVRNLSVSWFEYLPSDRQRKILDHFESMPDVEADYMDSVNGPSWFWWMLAILPLDNKTKLSILGMTSLFRRLHALKKVLVHVQANNIL